MIKKINSKYANIFISLAIVFAGALASFAIVQAQNQSGNDIVFPVEELGNCQNETECKTFCDKKENISACVDFAEKHSLMSKEEVKKAKAFARIGSGPGNCQSKDECEAYCEDQNNMDACLSFAEENNFMDEDDLKEAKQVAKALKEGVSLPGGCQNKKKCEAYCEDSEHMDECLSFAEKAGFMSGGELEGAKKAVKAMKSGVKPPGDCKGREQCKAYCEDESRADECADFAVKAGFMDKDEYEMFKKIGGKGPGGCKGKDECENFCNNPENQEACFSFGKEHNLIPEEKLKEMKNGVEKTKKIMEGRGEMPMEINEKIKERIKERMRGNFDDKKGEIMREFKKEIPQEMMDKNFDEIGDMPAGDDSGEQTPTKEELEAEGELSSEKTQDKTAQ